MSWSGRAAATSSAARHSHQPYAPTHTACLVYRMLKCGSEYVKRSLQEYEEKVRSQLERSLRRKAAALGYQLVPRLPSPAEPPMAIAPA